MNLGEILNIFNLVIADKAPDSEDLTPERFQTLLTYAQSKHFNAAVDKKKWNSLRPFTVVLGENGVMALPIDKDGMAELPSDYFDHKSTLHRYTKNDTIKHSQVRKVDDQKYDEMISSYIQKPDREYPILNVKDDFIRFSPYNLRYVIFTYIKEPADPVFGVNYDAGYPEYDPAESVELQWDNENILDIIFIMAKEFGAIVTIEDIQQAQQQQPKTAKK